MFLDHERPARLGTGRRGFGRRHRLGRPGGIPLVPVRLQLVHVLCVPHTPGRDTPQVSGAWPYNWWVTEPGVEPAGPLRGDITVRGSKNAVTKHMVAAMLGRRTEHAGTPLRSATSTSRRRCWKPWAIRWSVRRRNHYRARVGGAAEGAGSLHRPEPDPDPYAGAAAAPHRRGVRAAGRGRSHRAAAVTSTSRRCGPWGPRSRRVRPGSRPGRPGCTGRASTCPTRAWARPRPCCFPPCWPRQDGTAQRSHRARGWSSPCSCSGWARTSSSARTGGSSSRASPSCAVRPGAGRGPAQAFSYLVALLITRGEVRVHGCPQDRLVTAINTLARMGARFRSPRSGSSLRRRTGCAPPRCTPTPIPAS